jgi:transcription-repair coupling factor (superfamily II helicase)
VGLDLYTRLLASAVERVRDERRRAGRDTSASGALALQPMPAMQPEEPPTVSLDLPITAFLPEDYVPDDAVRLRLYQRMAASMTPGQIRDLRRELEDRFGALPEPAANLLEVLRLKGLAIAAGVESIRAMEHEFLIQTPQERTMPESLRMRLQRKFRDYVKVSPHQVRIMRSKAGAKWQEVMTVVLEEMGED